MKLAQLIYLALNDPGVRLALESGTLQAPHSQRLELEAASEVMRYTKNAVGDHSSSLFGGHGPDDRRLNSPDQWAWKE